MGEKLPANFNIQMAKNYLPRHSLSLPDCKSIKNKTS
jgi:hypothetical protein